MTVIPGFPRLPFVQQNALRPRSFPLNAKTHTPVREAAVVQFGKKSPPAADYPLVIIGGGLAGLTAAYLANKNGIPA